MSQPICLTKLGTPTISATFDGQTVVHDDDGNMTSGPLNSSVPVSYAYETRNRLTGAGGLTYTYDSEGNRITLTQGGQTTRFAMNPVGGLSELLVRTRPDGSMTYYVYGQGLLYDVETTSAGTETGVRHNYHYDYRGSTVAVSDGAGNVIERIEYSIYGQITRQTGTILDTPFLFNGVYGVQTDGNGLYCMRARYYNPYIKRFINADPTGLSAGLNFYAYTYGDPISLTDPFGLGYWSDVGQVFQGYGLAIAGTATGLYNVAAHPINTGIGLYNVAANPVQAYNAISTSVANTWNSGLVGQGQIVGNALIAAGTIGSGFAVATTRAAAIAAAEPELTEGMSTWQILSTYNRGAQALNNADYWGLGGDFTTPLEKAAKMTTGAYPLTTSFGEAISQSCGLWNTGLTPSAYIVPGIVGAGAEATGWLGNSGALGNLQDNSWSVFGNTASQFFSTGKSSQFFSTGK